AQSLEVRGGDLRKPEGTQVRMTELEDARPERELLAVRGDVPERDQGMEDSSCGGAREIRPPSDFAEREVRVVGVEDRDHGQPAPHRLDGVRPPGLGPAPPTPPSADLPLDRDRA